MHICQLPPCLRPGDRLAVIAPSGTLREREQSVFAAGLEIWRSRGYEITCLPSWDAQAGYLAGTDAQRRHALETALHDPSYQGILCVRGGFGGARLLEGDYGAIFQERSPKWLIGFSDITNLLWQASHAGLSSVHGPVLTTLAAEPAWSQERLFRWVEQHTITPLQGEGWGGETVTGLLLPGNLTVATHLLGTPRLPNLSNVILAIEDVSEVPYRIDRMLTQWRLSGELQKVKGIALGRFSQCEAPPGIPSFTVEEVLRDRLGDLGIPVVANLPFGHDGENGILPVGRPAVLNPQEGTLSI